MTTTTVATKEGEAIEIEGYTQDQLKARAKYFKTDLNQIEEHSFEYNVVNIEGQQYLVLTDEEATEKTIEAIKASLGTIHPNCWCKYYPYLVNNLSNPTLNAIYNTQQRMRENANELIEVLIGDNLDDLCKFLMGQNGRWLILSTYYGNEHKIHTQGSNYLYAYKIK